MIRIRFRDCLRVRPSATASQAHIGVGISRPAHHPAPGDSGRGRSGPFRRVHLLRSGCQSAGLRASEFKVSCFDSEVRIRWPLAGPAFGRDWEISGDRSRPVAPRRLESWKLEPPNKAQTGITVWR